MKVAIYGTGGVGGYLAARLAASGEAETWAIARGRHLEAIRADGLRLESPHGNEHVRVAATDDPAEVGPCDHVLVTVKATDLGDVASRLAPLMGADTSVVTFQNGIDAAERVGAAVGESRVVPGLVYIFSSVSEPGTVAHTSGPGTFYIGERDGSPSARVDELVQLLGGAGIDARSAPDIERLLWRKYAFICAQAGLTAASRAPIGVIRDDALAWRLFQSIVDEILGLSLRRGVDVHGNTRRELLEFAEALDPGSMSSLYHDLVRGHPSELASLHGTAVRWADEVGYPLPATAAVHAVLRVWERQNAEVD